MSSNPPIGAIAYGRSGVACLVTEREADRLALQFPDGKVKYVTLDSVVRWQMPQPLKPGDRALIISTTATGTVAHFDNELGIRLINIEGLYDPLTGYKVFSQWFDPLTLCCAMQENAA